MDLYKGLTPCMLLLVALSGAAAQVTVVNGRLGGSADFLVSVPPQTNIIAWNYKGVAVAQLIPTLGPQCVGQFIGRCELSTNGSLRLENVTYADQGEYILVAQNANIVLETKTFLLNIYAALTAPVLKLSSTSNPATALVGGTNVTLHCDAGIQNVTTYTFYQNQVNVCSKPHVICRGQFLDFQPIITNDSGTYTCIIQNPVNTNTSNNLVLTVIVPVSEVTLTLNTSDSLIWPERESVSLNCSALGTDVTFSWSLQGVPLPQNSRYQLTNNNSILIISPVSANDNGSFTCTASNFISNGTSNEIWLNLASPVSDVTLSSNTSRLLWEGEDSADLHCSAQGSAVGFSWRLNGQLLSNNGRYQITQDNSPPSSNLTISPVSREDSGLFSCTASNLENTVNSTSLSLDLAWRPDGNILCGAQQNNQNLELLCSWPGGHPAANVTMEFLNETDTQANQVNRTLTSNFDVKGSRMTCRGAQMGNTNNCTLRFDFPFPSVPTDPPVTEVKEGGNLAMTAGMFPGTQVKAVGLSDEYLPAHFSWVHFNPDRTPVVSGGRIQITSTDFTSRLAITGVTKEDNGTYQCTASNFLGNVTFTFKVEVTATTTSTPSSGLSSGAIAGIVIGVLAGVAIIGIIIFFIVKKT